MLGWIFINLPFQWCYVYFKDGYFVHMQFLVFFCCFFFYNFLTPSKDTHGFIRWFNWKCTLLWEVFSKAIFVSGQIMVCFNGEIAPYFKYLDRQTWANSLDADQTTFDQGLHCLPFIQQFVDILTHCKLNELSHTIYWNNQILILGVSGYVI